MEDNKDLLAFMNEEALLYVDNYDYINNVGSPLNVQIANACLDIDHGKTLCMDDDVKYVGGLSGELDVCFYSTNFPPSEPSDLCNTEYEGPYVFEVFVDPNGLKTPWEYSPLLNKIYIDIKQKFPINFSIKTRPEEGKLLFIRVTPVYEEDKYSLDLVHRCICHEQPHDATNMNVPIHITQHIIRCDNDSARYYGDKITKKRHNLIIPLTHPRAGTDSVKELFHFVCKTSCSGGEGMNRRPIQIIFTLEDDLGNILGRRVLRVRVCACPKRDKEKEEQKSHKHDPKGKKRLVKKPSIEAGSGIIPVTLGIIGEKNKQRLLRYARRLMADDMVRLQNSGGSNVGRYQKIIKDINNMLGAE